MEWINSEILGNYLTKQVIPHFVAQRARSGASKRVLLLVDGHASRINGELWQKFKDNGHRCDDVRVACETHTSAARPVRFYIIQEQT